VGAKEEPHGEPQRLGDSWERVSYPPRLERSELIGLFIFNQLPQ